MLCGTTDGTHDPAIPWATFSDGAVRSTPVGAADRQVAGPSVTPCNVIIGGQCYKVGSFYYCIVPGRPTCWTGGIPLFVVRGTRPDRADLNSIC